MKSFPQRKSPRLQGYDYAQAGAYFVTICTHQRQHLFGEVIAGEMVLNPSGKIAYEELQKIALYWKFVDVDLCVVMPNHVHAIILIDDHVGTRFCASGSTDGKNAVPTLGRVIGNYKSGVTRRLRLALNQPECVVWQSRYHDHIIRNEESLQRIRQYVAHNPELWLQDTFYTASPTSRSE